MTSINATLRSLSDAERHFLTGVVVARAKFYLGASQRGASVRYTPSVSVEMSRPDDVPLLGAIFGEPMERTYYGRPTYRFVIQDKSRIIAFITALAPLPPRIQAQADALRAFCDAESAQDQERAFRQFKALKDLT